MQGFAEKKRLEAQLLEDEKKKPKAGPHGLQSMSEGPMLLDETRKLEAQARAAYERSVRIELAAMRLIELPKKKKKKGKKRKGRKKKGGK